MKEIKFLIHALITKDKTLINLEYSGFDTCDLKEQVEHINNGKSDSKSEPLHITNIL